MPAKVSEYLSSVDFRDKDFVGTVAFRNEALSLPDGSKMALGIDDGHWVLVYQQQIAKPFKVFEYEQHAQKIFLDKKPGGEPEIKQFKQLVGYFIEQARVDDLVTILPPRL